MNSNIEKKRSEIISRINSISRARQGTLSEQYYGKGEKRQGPYYVLQGYTGNKHWSKRIPRDKVDQLREDLKTGEELKALVHELVDLVEVSTIEEDTADTKKNGRRRK